MHAATKTATDAGRMAGNDRDRILDALERFIRSRPGFFLANYYDMAGYRSDYRRALRDRDDALEMLRYVKWRESIGADDLIEALDNNRGRLTYDAAAGRFHYCASQYYCVEYRAGVCRFLVSVIWRFLRDNKEAATGDDLRKAAARELSRRLARRWFN